MNSKDLQLNKRHSVKFLRMVTLGKIPEAYEKYVDMNGTHHNAFFPAGFPSLQDAMAENHTKFPVKELQIKNVVAEGNMVAVHSHLVLNKGEAGMVVVHLFRFKRHKITEMWDCGQPIPADLPNKDGAF